MATDLTFDSKLARAIYFKNVDAILRLCDDSSLRRSILDYKKDGKRLVHFAAKFGSVILLEKLRSFGADLTIRSDDSSRYDSIRNSTTLHIASQSGSTAVVKCLQLFGKLDINELLLHNMTTLMVVVSEEDSKSARILCECGANVNLGTFKRGLTPIQYIAERSNCAEIIKVLLNFGANVNELWIKYSRRSWLRQSPLFMALKHGHTDNAKVLIKGGADVSFVGQLSNIGIGPIGCFSLAAKMPITYFKIH
ncbi:ANKRD28 [Mytilus edulis]|uniref:ANKRD28 n=1 Tax=Mytilus edulis TaxID=6550 RepID=A0A8S3UHL3_MYTED|nr:ANKRD28 [Mytilus edulis]